MGDGVYIQSRQSADLFNIAQFRSKNKTTRILTRELLFYLGSTISSNGYIDDDIQRRMAKASASFGRLHQILWNNHHVSMRVKGKIYRESRCPPSYREPRPGQCIDDR